MCRWMVAEGHVTIEDVEERMSIDDADLWCETFQYWDRKTAERPEG